MNKVLPIILLCLLGMTWSAGYAIVHYCTLHGVSPLGYAFWQSVGPAMVLTLLCFLTRASIPRSRPYLVFYGVAALIGIVLPNTNMYFTAAHLPSGILAVVVNTVPVMTYLLALSFREEAFNSKRLAGVIFVFIGLLVLVAPGVSFDYVHAPWILTALLSPIGFSLCAVYVSKWAPNDTQTASVAAGMLCASSCWLLPVIVMTGGFHPIAWPLHTVDQLILLEIVLSSLGYWLLFKLLRCAGAVYYSLVGGVVSLIGLFWGWLFFHEQLTMGEGVAVALILGGVLVVSLIPRQPA